MKLEILRLNKKFISLFTFYVLGIIKQFTKSLVTSHNFFDLSLVQFSGIEEELGLINQNRNSSKLMRGKLIRQVITSEIY